MPSAAWVAVMTVLPTPTSVMVLPLMVATPVVPLVYVMAPLLAEVGAVIVGADAPNTTLDALKLKPDRLGVAAATVKVAVAVPLA